MLAFPYLYQMYLCNTVFFCRTRTECYLLFSEIERCLLKHDIHAVCYVHNLSFEYQFLKSILHINYEKVFLIKNRKVAKFELESDTIIFKDSYLLSNMSLAKFCENYNTEEYQKDKDRDMLMSKVLPGMTPQNRKVHWCIPPPKTLIILKRK